MDNLFKFAGVGDRFPQSDRLEWVLTNPPSTWLSVFGVKEPAPWMWLVFVAVMAGLVWGIIHLYRREMSTCPLRVRMLLAGLRALVVLVLAVVLLGPALQATNEIRQRPTLVVLVDDSASMGTPDRYLDDDSTTFVTAALGRSREELRQEMPTRLQLVRQIMARDGGAILQRLAANSKLQIVPFTGRLSDWQPLVPATQPGGKLGAASWPEIRGEAQSTNLARALREALKALEAGPVSAIVVISDGQYNEGDDPVPVARKAAEKNVPVFTIAVGDTSPKRDLVLVGITCRESVWEKDPMTIDVPVISNGMGDVSFQVELTRQQLPDENNAATGAPVVIATATGSFSSGQTTTKVSLVHTPDKAGRYLLTARIPPLAREADPDNNVKSTNITVVKEQARVLLVAGIPTWEYQLVRALLMRDRSINLSCFLQSMDPDMPQDGHTPITELPDKREELLKYDVVVMIDPNPAPVRNPREIDQNFVNLLQEFVSKHGGGLMYVAGSAYTDRLLSSPQSREIARLLPVAFSEMDASGASGLVSSYEKEWPMFVGMDDHPILRLDADKQTNQNLWNSMPGVFWSYPSRKRPGGLVMIEHTDPQLRRGEENRPLMVEGRYGGGRVLYVGFTGSWRWRRIGRDSEFFDKFWVQSVRYLIEGRRLGAGRRGTIELKADKCNVGEAVEIKATLYDSHFKELEQPTVPAQLRIGNAPPQDFELRLALPGRYVANVMPRATGTAAVVIQLPGDTASQPVVISKQFEVIVPPVEGLKPELNRAVLAAMAEAGKGLCLEVNQLNRLADPQVIPDATRISRVPSRPAEVWDGRWGRDKAYGIPVFWWPGPGLKDGVNALAGKVVGEPLLHQDGANILWLNLKFGPLLVLLLILLTLEWGIRKWHRLM